MATTIRNATLKVTIKEEITLNGSRQDSENILRVSDINEVYKRIITCPANSETTLAHFHSSVADGTLAPLDIDDVKYIRVTNLDASTSVTLSLQSDVGEDDSAADESASLLIEAGIVTILLEISFTSDILKIFSESCLDPFKVISSLIFTVNVAFLILVGI